LKRFLSIPRARILDSSVEAGILSLTAAPEPVFQVAAKS